MAGQPALIRVAKALHWEIEGRPVAAVEQREAAFGGEAVVKPDTAVGQVNPGLRIYGRFATERCLVPSAAATRRAPSVLPCSSCRAAGMR